ncbi:MAG: radical SAM protein [Candidatus Wallbacteria bacterium]|nr:radical SAM protein [Candidatus Wallbacteria bacterium]
MQSFFWTLLGVAALIAGVWAWRTALRERRRRAFLARHYPDRLEKRRYAHKLLIISSTLKSKETGLPVKQRMLYAPGLAPALLAGLTPSDWDVELCYETIEDVPLDTDADLVAVTAMGYALWHAFDFMDEFRRRGKTVICGGPMASLVPDEALKHADAVCIGEAESQWQTILRDYENGVLKPRYESNLDQACEGLPVPRYDLIAEKRVGPIVAVLVGRGCPHSCEYCSIFAVYKNRYKRRTVDEVVRDVEAAKGLGFREILMVDDNIGADFRTAKQLFEALIPLGIRWVGQCALTILRRPDLLELARQSGCSTLSFGFETVNTASLHAHDKTFVKAEDYDEMLATLAKAGINVSSEMILGMDGDTQETFEATIDFVMRNKITLPRFYVLTPIPGTPLFERMRREGKILTYDYNEYNGATCVYQPKRLTPDQVEDGYWRVYNEVFKLSNILKRCFTSRIRTNVAFVLFLLGVNLAYRSQVRKRICPGLV